MDGDCIYIPRKFENEKSWGEKNGTRKFLQTRDSEIYNMYLKGATINQLVDIYFLSDKSIRRIVHKEKINFNLKLL
ncbi:CD3324 family protein [Clostridium senegalense]|uniref:CD3324 family protein n=1 Tax=Clostridium senegalense TaxID=1465809 RepID=UPI002E1DDA63